MASSAVKPDEVVAAFRRIEDFIMVSAGRPKADFQSAIRLFAEAAGLSTAAHETLRAKVEQLADDDVQASWCVLGAILGLFIASERTDD